jgi:hypothetical protein
MNDMQPGARYTTIGCSATCVNSASLVRYVLCASDADCDGKTCVGSDLLPATFTVCK